MRKKRNKNPKKNVKSDKQQLRWNRENALLKDFRAKAPHLKSFLRGRGCTLPFYDYLDSYSAEFELIAEAAIASHPSLLGIHEVDDQVFYANEQNWTQLGYNDLRQVFFTVDDRFADYGGNALDANLCGSMTAFHDAADNVRTVILIRKSIKVSVQHRELKYAFKIASLVHEIGHVEDLENETNFDVTNCRMDVIEAEVFAHLYALDVLARRSVLGLNQAFADCVTQCAISS